MSYLQKYNKYKYNKYKYKYINLKNKIGGVLGDDKSLEYFEIDKFLIQQQLHVQVVSSKQVLPKKVELSEPQQVLYEPQQVLSEPQQEQVESSQEQDDGFQLVQKPKKNKPDKKQSKDISFNEIKTIVLDTLLKNNPYSIYLYGSRARSEKTKKTQHRIDSDIDIMIFWKSITPSIDYLISLKEELIKNLGINVDFVNLVYNKTKIIKNIDERNQCYYDNVENDAINIYEKEKNSLCELLDKSIKLQKI